MQGFLNTPHHAIANLFAQGLQRKREGQGEEKQGGKEE